MVQEMKEAQEDQRYLLVRSGGLSCALLASDVVRVVRRLRCHAVPGSRSHLVGLAQYGGDPLPVLDLQALVEQGTSSARHQSTVILGRGRRRDRSVLGLAVDEVLRVVALPERAVEDSESGLVGEAIQIEGEEVKMLNTQQLLRAERDD
jgi:chemotaxis signal transduction protein